VHGIYYQIPTRGSPTVAVVAFWRVSCALLVYYRLVYLLWIRNLEKKHRKPEGMM